MARMVGHVDRGSQECDHSVDRVASNQCVVGFGMVRWQDDVGELRPLDHRIRPNAPGGDSPFGGRSGESVRLEVGQELLAPRVECDRLRERNNLSGCEVEETCLVGEIVESGFDHDRGQRRLP